MGDENNFGLLKGTLEVKGGINNDSIANHLNGRLCISGIVLCIFQHI